MPLTPYTKHRASFLQPNDDGRLLSRIVLSLLDDGPVKDDLNVSQLPYSKMKIAMEVLTYHAMNGTCHELKMLCDTAKAFHGIE